MCSTSTQITTPLPGDARDITIERLQAEMETLRKNSAMEKKNFKDQLLSKEVCFLVPFVNRFKVVNAIEPRTFEGRDETY